MFNFNYYDQHENDIKNKNELSIIPRILFVFWIVCIFYCMAQFLITNENNYCVALIPLFYFLLMTYFFRELD